MIRPQDEYAILAAMADAIKERQKVLKEEIGETWEAAGITSAEVDIMGRRLGKLGVRRTEKSTPVVVDAEAFEPFEREHFRVEHVEVDASKLPASVLQTLQETYDCISAWEDELDWRGAVYDTPAGAMTADGEVVPGVAFVHDTDRTLAFVKEKGVGYADILSDANKAAALPQAVARLRGAA